MTQFYTVVPHCLAWTTPEAAHSDEPERVEQYLVGPVARGEISGLQGLDIYYGCQHIGVGSRK